MLKLRLIHYYTELHYAEFRYAECRNAECRYAECHGATSIIHPYNSTKQENNVQPYPLNNEAI
jgi:hypothetical protein